MFLALLSTIVEAKINTPGRRNHSINETVHKIIIKNIVTIGPLPTSQVLFMIGLITNADSLVTFTIAYAFVNATIEQ